MTATDYQQRIAQNIKVLLTLTGVGTQSKLSRLLGWNDRARLSKLMSGRQDWTLSDLIAVGDVLNPTDPLILTWTLDEVVSGRDPEQAAPKLRHQLRHLFRDSLGTYVVPFRQANACTPQLSEPAVVIDLALARRQHNRPSLTLVG